MTDKQWAIVRDVLRKENRGKHFAKHSKRELINATLYLNKTGCQWSLLPNDFPPYKTVSSFYHRAKKSGLWERIMSALVKKIRSRAKRKAKPTYGIIDSQSVKTMYS
jgi:putative transposase